MAYSSAVRSGSRYGNSATATPRRMESVHVAAADMSTVGDGMTPWKSKWCSPNQKHS